jgi:hypothetical protein
MYLRSTVDPPHHPSMDRGRFVFTSLAGAFAAPLGAWAQVTGRIPRVGVLAGGDTHLQRAFHGRLAELGHREGHNVRSSATTTGMFRLGSRRRPTNSWD